MINIAARIVGVETHTLCYYKRIGLVQTYHFKGNIRYYSEADIERLRHIKTLMDGVGISLAWVGILIRMAEMQHQIQEMEFEI